MTNDETSADGDNRRGEILRHSCFVIPATFVIRHSTFSIAECFPREVKEHAFQVGFDRFDVQQLDVQVF
jgi:hypothetical protein